MDIVKRLEGHRRSPILVDAMNEIKSLRRIYEAADSLIGPNEPPDSFPLKQDVVDLQDALKAYKR
jgi:hypothetical protein